MPLSLFPSGSKVSVSRVEGAEDTRAFLASLGFTKGEPVKVVVKSGGNIIVNIKETRVALDEKLASRICCN